MAKTRIVLDTNQVATGGAELLEYHPELPVYEFVCRVFRRHMGLYSQEIGHEYCETLRERYPRSPRLVGYLGTIVKLGKKVRIASNDCTPRPTDPASVKFVLCGLDGDADLLVTDNEALLKVSDGYPRPRICPREEAERCLAGRQKTEGKQKQ